MFYGSSMSTPIAKKYTEELKDLKWQFRGHDGKSTIISSVPVDDKYIVINYKFVEGVELSHRYDIRDGDSESTDYKARVAFVKDSEDEFHKVFSAIIKKMLK